MSDYLVTSLFSSGKKISYLVAWLLSSWREEEFLCETDYLCEISSCVELSKAYSRVSCMNSSAILMWRKIIHLSSLSIKNSFKFNSDLGQ
jgi:hypothetical protein